jgi:hypothetical protein
MTWWEMTHENTAKSQHAEHLLKATGIYYEMETIIIHCTLEAYGLDPRYDDFETYEKNGYIHFLQDNDLIDRNCGSLSDEEITNCRRFFDNGKMSRCFFGFQPPHMLHLKFFMKDDYISNKTDKFNLFVDVFFPDFYKDHEFKISAYTQPIIDTEHDVSQALFWHALAR